MASFIRLATRGVKRNVKQQETNPCRSVPLKSKAVVDAGKPTARSHRCRTPDPLGVRVEERETNDGNPRKEKRTGKREHAPCNDRTLPNRTKEDKLRPTSPTGRISRTRSRTPTGHRRRGRSLNKGKNERKRSLTRKPMPKPNLELKPIQSERRSLSRIGGRFVSQKKCKNTGSSHSRICDQSSRSSNPSSRGKSRGKKKDGDLSSNRNPNRDRSQNIGAPDEPVKGKASNEQSFEPKESNANNKEHARLKNTKKNVPNLQDKYQPRIDYSIGDTNSLVTGLNVDRDCTGDSIAAKYQIESVYSQTTEDVDSFDDLTHDADDEGWLASYDAWLGAICDFDVDRTSPRRHSMPAAGDKTW